MSPRFALFIRTSLAAMAAAAIGCSGPAPNLGLTATAMVAPPDAGTDNAAVGSAAPTAIPINLPTPEENERVGAAAPAPMRPQYQSQTEGSPLCNASDWMGCYPDDAKTTRATDCGASPDARGNDGGASGDDGVTQSACHVQRSSDDAGVRPVCTASGSSTDGMMCSGPTDCAPGYECVGTGKCQPYCCKDACSRPDQFCDIQPTAKDPALKVPVCMPIQTCGLLDSGGAACPDNATCAVVRFDTGATGCVAIGPSQAGDQCNTVNCARGLTCLGTPGEKSCYILCHTGERTTECASTPKQTCKGGIPLFPNPGIGICE
jgi:hypothetical protein